MNKINSVAFKLEQMNPSIFGRKLSVPQSASLKTHRERPQYVSVRESVAVCDAYKDTQIDVGKCREEAEVKDSKETNGLWES